MFKRILFGIGVLGLAGLGGSYWYLRQEPLCQVCQRPIHKQTFYRIYLEGGAKKEVCCPRCGLRFQQDRADVRAAEVADFSSGERFDAERAFYVENGSVHLCCSENLVQRDSTGRGQYVLAWDRCLPSLVAFKTREDAEEFRQQNGGTIKTYEQLPSGSPAKPH